MTEVTKQKVRENVQAFKKVTVNLDEGSLKRIDRMSLDTAGKSLYRRSQTIRDMADFCNANIPSFEAWVRFRCYEDGKA